MNEQEAAQKAMTEILGHARRIYQLMKPGMVLDLTWPELAPIIVIGKPSKLERIIITRPLLHIDIAVENKPAPAIGPNGGGVHDGR